MPDAEELRAAGSFKQACETGCWGGGVDPRLVLSDTRVLDVLLHNSDRHHGHFLFGQHWTTAVSGAGEGGTKNGEGDAKNGGCGFFRPFLIDHAASFRKEAFVSLEHENAFQTGATLCVGSRTYLR